ncbi:RNA polymerase sigma factor [Saccharomonospora sp. NPDC046836]|uniref:RNA polymerase sigma factor n=1 Tax=Saccharomonospora sp. NPDC046836 TaxID=3156921 RepID=UPI0033F81675
MSGLSATALAEQADEDLLGQVRGGDRNAFSELFARHHGRALRYATAIAATRVDAEDLAADALVRLMLALEQGRGPVANVAAYLRTTIRRLAIDMGVKNARSVSVGLEIVAVRVPAQANGPDPAPTEAEAMVDSAFTSLPRRWREVLWMVEVLGYSPGDIARVLGIAPPAACSLLWRARRALRQRYGELVEPTP